MFLILHFVSNHDFLIYSFFQAPARAPAAAAARPRPSTIERPLQYPLVEYSGEGTSSGVQPVRERTSPTRASSSSAPQVVAGRLTATPDLMVRYWTPPGELYQKQNQNPLLQISFHLA